MKKLYEIEENIAKITVQSKIYPIVTIKKAISNYMQDVSIKIEERDTENVDIYLVFDENKVNIEYIINDFYNELLREALRYEISCDTKNLRELMLARALYTTCVEIDNTNLENNEEAPKELDELVEDYNLDDIAVNWFDKNINNEEE